MKYVGSKGRHAKQILPIILAERKEGQAYVEPFVGGANTIQHVGGKRIGGDMHEGLIALWRAVSSGWTAPESVSEEEYKDASERNKLGEVSPLISYIGFPCSYGGKWFGGMARGGLNSDGSPRDHTREAYRNSTKQFPLLKGVEFHNCSYDAMPIPDNSIIYCDPPYAGTMEYSTGGFNHAEFWDWVRLMSGKGHNVFVSEYSAPEDFVCVWSKEVNSTIDQQTGSRKAVERLFTLRQ